MQNENNAAGQYGYAMKKGRKTAARDRLKKKDPYLAVLDDIVDDKVCQSVDLGEIDVPSQLIIGTKNSSRANAFSSDFMPILNEKSEFANSWIPRARRCEKISQRQPLLLSDEQRDPGGLVQP